MKIVTTSKGKQSIKISNKEWKAIGKQAGWLNKLAGTPLPEGTQFYEDTGIHKIPIIPGYYMFKENQMWGKCPSYKNENDSTDILYYYEGQLWRWEELKADLQENWRPVRQEEQDWFRINIY